MGDEKEVQKTTERMVFRSGTIHGGVESIVEIQELRRNALQVKREVLMGEEIEISKRDRIEELSLSLRTGG